MRKLSLVKALPNNLLAQPFCCLSCTVYYRILFGIFGNTANISFIYNYYFFVNMVTYAYIQLSTGICVAANAGLKIWQM